MATRMRKVWDRGEAVLNGWLTIPSTVTAETVARQDYNSIVVDLQHGLIDYQMALPMIQAIGAASDATVIARPPWNEPGIIMKLLDAGAWGNLCPMINNPGDAEALMRACHYAPRGQRSVAPTRAMMVYGPSYIQDANRHVVTLAMIETREALDHVEAIARTPDLSGLYIGPSDLAQSLGYPIQLDPTGADTMVAVERILHAAKAAGIKAGMHCMMPDYARSMVAKGFEFVTLGTDLRMFNAEVAARVARSAAGEMRDAHHLGWMPSSRARSRCSNPAGTARPACPGAVRWDYARSAAIAGQHRHQTVPRTSGQPVATVATLILLK